ncbi:MAG: LCP family protein [Chloroflexi bacterium]|nr:LCP family protein [Chloroflexota bacterium]
MKKEPPREIRLPERPEGEPQEGRGRRYRPLLVFGIAAFAVLAFYALLAVITQLDDYFLPGNEIDAGFLNNLPFIDSGNPDFNDRINILVLGLDRRLDEPKDLATRTDTVFVLTIDPASNTAGVFSIPRDLWVEIPDGQGGFFEQRINVAYEFGENGEVKYKGGGPALAKDTIEHNFGIHIDHYAVLDFENFISVIDELGGVDIDVPEYVYDPLYEECYSCGYYAVEFLPGPQHMDGVRALAYARIRYGSGDLQRIERQHLVMRATLNKAADLGLLLNPKKLLSLFNKYRKSFRTDISAPRAFGIALKANDIPQERIRMISLKDAVFSYTGPGGEAALEWDRDKVEGLKRQLFLDGRIQAEAAKIELQNATDVPGLATDVAERLSNQGLWPELLALADNPASDRRRTLIYNLNGKDYTAEKLAEWLGLSEDQVTDDADRAPPTVNGPADIIIILGRDVVALTRDVGG